MTALDPNQLSVARLLFSLPSAQGYALAGGAALLAVGVIDRPTRDVDAFVAARPGASPGDVRPLVSEAVPALESAGWTVETVRLHQTFARLVAKHEPGVVEIDLAVDSPPLFPVGDVDGIPVLALEDLAARKILAILDRAEGRDFTDLLALAERFSPAECVDWAVRLDAGITPAMIADSFATLDRLGDHELPTDDPGRLRASFLAWSHDLRST